MVEQLAQHFGFASQEGRYSIGGILSWSLHAMTEVFAVERRPHPGFPDPATTERMAPTSEAASGSNLTERTALILRPLLAFAHSAWFGGAARWPAWRCFRV
jgi:hypothetical protein